MHTSNTTLTNYAQSFAAVLQQVQRNQQPVYAVMANGSTVSQSEMQWQAALAA